MTSDLFATMDEDARALVEERGAPLDYSNLDIAAARRTVESRPRRPGPEVAEVSEHKVVGVHGTFRVRVLRPRTGVVLPAIIYYHGGGRVVGSIDSFDGIARSLAVGCDAVVVNVDYFLAPEHPYPVATDQAHEAVLWVFENSAMLGIDDARVSVAGDSAGGGLAAGVALQLRDTGGPRLLSQLLLYPGLDHGWDFPSAELFEHGPILTRKSAQWMKDCYYQRRGPDEISPYGAPGLAEDLSGLPPAIVVSAEFDIIRDGCERYGQRLREAGVEVVLIRYPGVLHGFITQDMRRTQHALDDICALMRNRQARATSPVPVADATTPNPKENS